jgi:hypothetical protein
VAIEEQRAACRVDRRPAPEEDEDEDEVDERNPSRTDLKAACERLTRAVWRGDVADGRLPDAVRSDSLPRPQTTPGLVLRGRPSPGRPAS